MEVHIINIVRFVICILAVVIAIAAMIKADDNNAMRRLSAVLAIISIYFNEQIGAGVYLLIGSSIETMIAATGVGFVLILLLVVMLSPVLFVIRWLVH